MKKLIELKDRFLNWFYGLPRLVKKGLALTALLVGFDIALLAPGFIIWAIGMTISIYGTFQFETQCKKEVLEDLSL